MQSPSRALALAATAALLTACGSAASDPAADTASSGAIPTTHRALAAAVIDHVGQRASAAAALTTRDGVRRSDWGVEVAFPVPAGDSTHVRVVVTRSAEPWSDTDCRGKDADAFTGCEERTVGGSTVRLVWEAEAPEEDPGNVAAVARRKDGYVLALATGPAVPRKLEGSELQDLADSLEAIATDPAVGFTTTRAAADAGEEIGDDVWLDWFGKGNGAPSPAPKTQHQG